MNTFNLLGQMITMGKVYGDVWAYDGYLQGDLAASYFDPIAWIEENGGIPDVDTEYPFYDTDVFSDGDPAFAFQLTYVDATHFRIQYQFRQTADLVWTNTYPAIFTFLDGYVGAVKGEITMVDRARNGLWLQQIDPEGTMAGNTHAYSVALIHELAGVNYYSWEDVAGTPIYLPLPDQYRVNTADFCYKAADVNNQPGTFIENFGIPALLSTSLCTEITNFVDDNTSGPGGRGGDGNYRFWSDPIDWPALPDISIMDTGMASMWHMDTTQCESLSSFLWSSSFIDNVLKLIADPLENIIAFGVVPINLSSLDGTLKDICVGNVNTGIQAYPLSSQYIPIDLGEISLLETWGTAIDYTCTEVALHLPFVGVITLPTVEVMDCEKIAIRYNVDLLSGDFIAMVKLTKARQLKGALLNSVMYTRMGNLLLNFPLTEANYGRMYSKIIQGLTGAAAGLGTGNVGQTVSSLVDTAMSLDSVPVERTGNYGGSIAGMSIREPYLILTQPIQVFDKNMYPKLEGMPSYWSYQIKNCSGFVKVEAVKDNTVIATAEEKDEIERLLKEGIWV